MPDNLVPNLAERVEHLTHDMELLKENNKYLYNKLDKVLGDRIELRAENYKLKKQVENGNGTEEEECLACSA